MKRQSLSTRFAKVTLLALASFAPLHSPGANILTNGDFEARDTDFASDYPYRACAFLEGTHDVVTNAACHPSGFSFQDHTSGAGFMLIANGSADTNLSVWRQTVTVATNKVYAFSGWVASWGGCPTWVDTNAPAMRIIINGTQYGGSVQAQPRAGVWQSFTALWNSGSSTEADIEVRLQTTSGIGNDIALDDLSFESLTDIRILTTTSSVSDAAAADSGADAQKTSPLTTVAIYRSVDIEWQSAPNRVYQVQWASSIPSDTWFNLGSPTLARGTKTSVTDRMLMHDKRFYRVLCLE